MSEIKYKDDGKGEWQSIGAELYLSGALTNSKYHLEIKAYGSDKESCQINLHSLLQDLRDVMEDYILELRDEIK
jgi:hypothetical protein